MQVLHSKDLVSWEIVGQVFDRLSMAPKYDEMKGYSQGTWAPALRYHNGEFYIFVCTPQDGLFMWHAKNSAGPLILHRMSEEGTRLLTKSFGTGPVKLTRRWMPVG